ncbi:MAG: ankyrin repeat domain-containing protein [Synergistaceae bacterium]|nr:ankyrin repeat domain-containing protein [Synergistaceae bacterium]
MDETKSLNVQDQGGRGTCPRARPPLRRTGPPELPGIALSVCQGKIERTGLERIPKSLLDLLSVPGQSGVILDAIREGADVNVSSGGGFTPLMLAALLNDDPVIVRALIEAGADVNAETREGMTALTWALQAETQNPDDGDLRGFLERDRRRVEAAMLLVESGADVNVACCSPRRMRWTPLLFATLAPDRNAEVIGAMLAAGAGANARTTEDVTPLFHAAAFGRSSDVVRDLIRAGADVNARGGQEGRRGWTPLLYALTGPCKSRPIVEELLGNGASVDVVVGNGQTPLHFAAVIGDTPAFVHALLEAGADADALDGDGNSALDNAMSQNHKNVVRRLLRAKTG